MTITLERAREAGATAVDELQQGYGRCVYRCFQEAIARGNELIVLCEGDRTFRAYDLDKFLAYAPHADIVNGTRTVERLRARHPAQHLYLLWQPVGWTAARGKAPWPEHDHRHRHDLQTLPPRSAHSADVALETDRKTWNLTLISSIQHSTTDATSSNVRSRFIPASASARAETSTIGGRFAWDWACCSASSGVGGPPRHDGNRLPWLSTGRRRPPGRGMAEPVALPLQRHGPAG